jgi:hypothetical protein
LTTWVTIASWPAWPFNFFTVALPAHMTSAQHRLFRCFSLSTIFTTSKNNDEVWDPLLCPTLSRSFAFLFVHSCYFPCAHPARAWSVLSLLPARELPSSHPDLHQWLQMMQLMSPRSIGGIQQNSLICLLLMIRLLPQRRLLLIKMPVVMRRIHPETPAIAETPSTMVVV